MQDMGLAYKISGAIAAGLLLVGGGIVLAGQLRAQPTVRRIQVQQNWSLQMGSQVAGYAVSGGLGDITLNLAGASVQMPFDGEVEPTGKGCVLLSSAEVPAYLFRLCGLRRAKLGVQRQHQPIGRAEQLGLAVLRKQPDGTWVMVEPSVQMVEQFIAG
ncbi:MAG: hypothetical protein AAFZ80_12725 [Cyanobacteria bacterium P01_A01_bin.105]